MTVDNFDFTREIITASRGAVTAAKYRIEAAHKAEGTAVLHAATRVPSRPVGLPHADASAVATLMSKQQTVKLAEFYGFVEGHRCPSPSERRRRIPERQMLDRARLFRRQRTALLDQSLLHGPKPSYCCVRRIRSETPSGIAELPRL
jgi:hypothetical protein